MNIIYCDTHKIIIISPTINFMGGKVGGPMSHTTFTITKTNIKWRTTQTPTEYFLLYDDTIGGAAQCLWDELKTLLWLPLPKPPFWG